MKLVIRNYNWFCFVVFFQKRREDFYLIYFLSCAEVWLVFRNQQHSGRTARTGWCFSTRRRKVMTNVLDIATLLGQKKYMCVYCHMSRKSRVCRSGLFFFFFLIIDTTGNSRIRFRYLIFENSGKWRIMQFFYLLCS